jgi:adenylate kinase family enzyme
VVNSSTPILVNPSAPFDNRPSEHSLGASMIAQDDRTGRREASRFANRSIMEATLGPTAGLIEDAGKLGALTTGSIGYLFGVAEDPRTSIVQISGELDGPSRFRTCPYCSRCLTLRKLVQPACFTGLIRIEVTREYERTKQMIEHGVEWEKMQRTVVIENSGSGKSRLAQHLAELRGVPVFDLDEFHWEAGAYGERRDEATAKRLVSEAAAQPVWIVEGVYGWLARVALPRASALIWLDLSWEDCKRGLTDRGLRRGMTTEDHAALVVRAADYWTRDNANSFNGHFRLFEVFRGLRVRLKSRAQIDQFSASVVEWSGEDQG